MFASRQRGSFGKREVTPSSDTPARLLVEPAASHADPGFRVLPEPPPLPGGIAKAAAWMPQADILQRVGPVAGAPVCVLPVATDRDHLVCASYVAQEARRARLGDELLRLHGVDAIRPFFVFGEGVFNTAVGRWLIDGLGLLPYDDWNVIYLPLDAPTAAAMRLPYHPRTAIARVDTLIHDRLAEQRDRYEVTIAQTAAVLTARWDAARLERFLAWRDGLRAEVLAYAEQIQPMIVGLIAEAQEKVGRS